MKYLLKLFSLQRRRFLYNNIITTMLLLLMQQHRSVCSFIITRTGCKKFNNIATGRIISSIMTSRYYNNYNNQLLSTTTWLSKEKEFIEKQKQVSSSSSSASSTTEELSSHYEHQKKVFDNMAEYFATGETISDDLQPIYKYLAKSILEDTVITSNHNNKECDDNDDESSSTSTSNNTTCIRILDIACGSGALWPFLASEATSNNIKLNVIGVDISNNMVQAAADMADKLFEEYIMTKTKHTFQIIESNILDYNINNNNNKKSEIDDEQQYDIIIMNACFGNFINQTAVLEHVTNNNNILKLNGYIYVTHPLGANFVIKLHNEDPRTVPNLLPITDNEWNKQLLLTLPLQLEELIHPTITINDNNNNNNNDKVVPFYLAKIRKVRARTLTNVMRFRGIVDYGYGRGGKKLGFPTANLPSNLFQDALHNISTGVYFGYAIIEGRGNNNNNNNNNNNKPYKAVVNVGYSPTFEGQENKEKIIEAHLITPAERPIEKDFYGEVMRLQLIGYLRPEIKFPNFPSLIQQIQQDVIDANNTLDQEPYIFFQNESFLQQQQQQQQLLWIGNSGGNNEASWEYQNIYEAIQNV